jgi:ATP-dependent DNA helicase RecG
VESVLATVVDRSVTRTRTGKEIIEVTVSDDTGMLRCIFFNQKMIYSLKPGVRVVLSGRVERWQNSICFKSPNFELADREELLNTGRLVPVYSLAGNLKQPTLRRLIKMVVDRSAMSLSEHLPPDIKQRNRLPDLSASVKNLHFPPDLPTKEQARRRLAFDEFFLIQLGVLMKRREWQDERPSIPMKIDPGLLDGWYKSLPFALTTDQSGAIYNILGDMSKEKPMRRLVQGDVGSGKTVVAATALLSAVSNGYQGVLMAPTQILAEQHYKGLSRLFENFAESDAAKARGLKPRVALLSGAVKKKGKEATYAELSEGTVDIVIGTTAIIQDGVIFNKLGLVITDEQHRFGVVQRSTLRDKADNTNPHVLTMTATPIPRSLSLTIYGDLDISVIKTMPPGRKAIKTKWVMPDERERSYNFIRKQVQMGYQAFVICPLVEESDKLEQKAAVEEHARLQREVFPDLKLALLHGRMKPAEKDAIMLSFRDKKHDILVATSVIEVGIDIPNATIILIEGADRFGLAQLHQFRGRVGRGEAQSYCLLLASDDVTQVGQQRLRIIEQSTDGFYLAEEDLKMRGPGEFFGTRQSGVPDLRVAGLGDTDLLELAREEANALFTKDPLLQNFPLLEKKVSQLWNTEGDLS